MTPDGICEKAILTLELNPFEPLILTTNDPELPDEMLSAELERDKLKAGGGPC